MERIEKGKEHFIFELEDETGTGQMDVYRVFPGIHLTYNNFRMLQCELKLACLQLLLYLKDMPADEKMPEPVYFSRAQVEKIKKTERFLCENLEHKYTLKELSEMFNIPVTTLRKCFAGVFGDSVACYMRKKRVEKAMELLCKSNKTVAQIAAELGYENPSRFAQAFRTYANVSPQVYRIQYRGQK